MARPSGPRADPRAPSSHWRSTRQSGAVSGTLALRISQTSCFPILRAVLAAAIEQREHVLAPEQLRKRRRSFKCKTCQLGGIHPGRCGRLGDAGALAARSTICAEAVASPADGQDVPAAQRVKPPGGRGPEGHCKGLYRVRGRRRELALRKT